MDASPESWTANLLRGAPLIAPARQFTWPQSIPGEEDALARGAVRVQVRPREGAPFLLTCALGFKEPSLPTGIYPCPHPDWICVLAGGYAYLADTLRPGEPTLLAIKPVAAVHHADGLLLFTGFHTMLAWGREGLAWQTASLSWEGIRITGVTSETAEGLGWDLLTDREIPFRVDLRDGTHTGGPKTR
jgi:hypothetical protein